MNPMSVRRLIQRLLLSLLLVFAQQQAQLHVLGHSLADLVHQTDAGTADEQNCAACLAFAHLDDAAAPTGPVLPPVCGLNERPLATGFASFAAPLCTGYHSRAPPTIS